MITIETAVALLEFAYCSVKSKSLYHIVILQDATLQCSTHVTTD